MGKLVFGGVLTILLACSPARATLLTAEFTADNAFQAYISTSDSTLGTLIGSGTNWEQAQSFSTPLLGVGTFYLHIVAENYALSTSAIAPSDPSGGNPNAILGQFTLTGGDTFGNGSTTLYTSTDSVWRAQSVAVNAAWTAPSGAPSYQYSDGLTNDYCAFR